MSIENKFVPMPEAQTERIRTSATLPFGVEKDIGININKLHRIMQLGGVSCLKISSEQNGDVSKSDVDIVGLDSQGNALAAKTKVNYVPTCSSKYVLEKNNENDKQACWIDMSVTFNTEELKQRLLHSGKKVNESKNWSIEIDKALKKQIVKNCSIHLTSGFNTLQTTIMGFIYGLDLLSSMDMGLANIKAGTVNPHLPVIGKLLYELTLTGTVFSAVNSIYYGVERKRTGRRLSFFYGFEIDRLALLVLNTSTSTLAKTLK